MFVCLSNLFSKTLHNILKFQHNLQCKAIEKVSNEAFSVCNHFWSKFYLIWLFDSCFFFFFSIFVNIHNHLQSDTIYSPTPWRPGLWSNFPWYWLGQQKSQRCTSLSIICRSVSPYLSYQKPNSSTHQTSWHSSTPRRPSLSIPWLGILRSESNRSNVDGSHFTRQSTTKCPFSKFSITQIYSNVTSESDF